MCQIKQVAAIVEWVKGCVTLFRADKLLRQALQNLQEAFKSLSGARPLLLITDVCTRWNYTFLMLERFYVLAEFVKDSLTLCGRNEGAHFRADHVTLAQDYLNGFEGVVANIRALVEVLRPCKVASDLMESDRGQLSQLLFVQDTVEVQLKVKRSVVKHCL